MTEALSPLLARVEKLTGKEAHITPGWGRQYREALLPGYRWGVLEYPHAEKQFNAHVVQRGKSGWGASEATAPTPALALVLATLRAHAAKETI